jgi:FG-GAP-like repeat/Bacterial Ig-like domain (group 2)/FG-GAP repeat
MWKHLGNTVWCVSLRFRNFSLQFLFGVAMCSVVFLSACGGGGSKLPAAPTLVSVSVSPQNGSVAAGLTQQYKATGNYSDGTSQTLNTVTWATSNAAIATVNSSGLVTTIKQGAVNVSATSGTTSSSTPLTVSPAYLVSISVSPQNPSIFTRQTEQFAATGSYTDGSTQTLTSVTWTSSSTDVATINATGLATGFVTGNSTIGATSGTVNGSTTLTVTTPAIPALSYVLGATFASGGTNPSGVVVADFNGDGKPDIAVSNQGTNTIAVFLNDGSGGFGAAPISTTVQTTSAIGAIANGDFNEDGKVDLVVTVNDTQTIVLLGNGDGTFNQQPAIANATGFLQCKVADLNGDGHQDLVLAYNGGMAVSLGKGDGTFGPAGGVPPATPPPTSAGTTYFSVAVADFNGDGKLDIAAPDAGSPNDGVGTLDFWPGNGDGTFGNPTSVALFSTFPGSIASGDFNGDGKQDVLIGFPTAAAVVFGNGDGTFDVSLAGTEFVYSNTLLTTSGGVYVLAAPLAKDGRIDGVTSDFNLGVVQIAFNGAIGQPPRRMEFSHFLFRPEPRPLQRAI